MRDNHRIPKIGVRFTTATANDLVGRILQILDHYKCNCGMRPIEALGCLAIVEARVLQIAMRGPTEEEEPPPDEPGPEPEPPTEPEKPGLKLVEP